MYLEDNIIYRLFLLSLPVRLATATHKRNKKLGKPMVIRYAHEGSASPPASIKTKELYGNRA